MDKTITISGQLEQFHKELQLLHIEERKDNYILLALLFAGILGVYSLISFGQSNEMIIDSPSAIEVGGVQSKAPENATLFAGF